MQKSIHLLLALVLAILLTAAPALSASADAGSIEVIKQADREVAAPGDVITYTYIIINGIDKAIKNLSLKDSRLGNIPLTVDNEYLPSGENITATATYKVEFKDLLAGSIKNTATLTAEDEDGNELTASSNEVTVSIDIIKALLTKAQILKLSGVPGKGIDKAPGLQKPFNASSHAADHAGKKNGQEEMEQNRHQEINQNTGRNQEQNTEQETNGQTWQNRVKGKGHSK